MLKLSFLEKQGLAPKDWTIKSIIGTIGVFTAVAQVCIGIAMYFIVKDPLQKDFIYGVACTQLVIIVALSWLMYLYVISRPHRYSTFPKAAHNVNHKIRDAVCKAKNFDTTAINVLERETSEEVIEEICNSFEKVTGLPCRACISFIEVANDEDVQDGNVRVIFRDKDSKTQCGDIDENSKEAKNPVSSNTSYKTVITSHSRKIFLCNDLYDLHMEGKYESTSFEKYGGKPDLSKGRKTWRLPYLSAVVAPIWFTIDGKKSNITSITKQNTTDEKNDTVDSRFYGFLCIDSLYTNAFDAVHTEDLVGTFADSLCLLYSSMESEKQRAAGNVQQTKGAINEEVKQRSNS